MTSCPRCGRYTTAPTHCGADVGQAAVCACGCRAMAHGYRTASGRNDGTCLGLGCACAAYVESGGNPSDVRDSGPSTSPNDRRETGRIGGTAKGRIALTNPTLLATVSTQAKGA